MKYDRMFMVFLLVVSITALVVGSIALSKDDRNALVLYGKNNIVRTNTTHHYPKNNSVVKITNKNYQVINIEKGHKITLEIQSPLYLGKSSLPSIPNLPTYLVTEDYVEGKGGNNYLTTVVENNSNEHQQLDIVFSDIGATDILQNFVKTKTKGVYSFAALSPTIQSLTGLVKSETEVNLYKSAKLKFVN